MYIPLAAGESGDRVNHWGSPRNEPWQMKHLSSVLPLNSDTLITLVVRLFSFLTDVTHRASKAMHVHWHVRHSQWYPYSQAKTMPTPSLSLAHMPCNARLASRDALCWHQGHARVAQSSLFSSYYHSYSSLPLALQR